MDTVPEVLLIIVSAVLVIFLMAMIALAYYLITVMKDVKRISQRADNVASAIDSAAHAFEKSATPIALVKLAGAIFSRARKVHKDKKKE